MDNETIRMLARDLFNLSLTDPDAARLAHNLAGLKEFLQAIEEVPLPFLGDPFVVPASGDAWLEAWAAEGTPK